MHVDIEGKRLGIGCSGNNIRPVLLSAVFVVVGLPPTRPVIPTWSDAPAPTTHDGYNNDNIDNKWWSQRSSLPGRVRATRAWVSVWHLSSRDAPGKRSRRFQSEMQEQADEARRRRGQYNCVSGGLSSGTLRSEEASILLPGRLGLHRMSYWVLILQIRWVFFWQSHPNGLILGVKFYQRNREKITLKS